MNINFHTEALEFAKENDQNRASSVAVIEKAMRKGAELMVVENIALVAIANAELKKKRALSAPHRQVVKPINIQHDTSP